VAIDSVFSGGGEMGALMRALDWSQTPLGPVSNWTQSLKTAVRIVTIEHRPGNDAGSRLL